MIEKLKIVASNLNLKNNAAKLMSFTYRLAANATLGATTSSVITYLGEEKKIALPRVTSVKEDKKYTTSAVAGALVGASLTPKKLRTLTFLFAGMFLLEISTQNKQKEIEGKLSRANKIYDGNKSIDKLKL